MKMQTVKQLVTKTTQGASKQNVVQMQSAAYYRRYRRKLRNNKVI